MNQSRLQTLLDWVADELGIRPAPTPAPLAGDAGARKYYRLQAGQRSWILMDSAPADQGAADELRRFLDITGRLRGAGLHAPAMHAENRQLGALLLEDLGDRLYRDLITPENAARHYADVFTAMQTMATSISTTGLPDYDRHMLLQEMNLFPEWYADKWLQQPLSTAELAAWQALTDWLCTQALQQPQVFVHRDLHSCNVLQVARHNPGIIDYQDAVCGPLTYDLISWLVDRYIQWPRANLLGWYEQHRQRLGISVDAAQWRQWCDAMSMQRKLKVLGIFARLALRDGKPNYLRLQPVFYHHLLHTAPLYAATRPLLELLGKRPPVMAKR